MSSNRTSNRRSALVVLVSAALLVPLGGTPAGAAAQGRKDPDPTSGRHENKRIKDQYIVTFDKAASTADVDKARKRAEGRGGKVHHKYKKAVKGFSATMSAEAVAELQKDPNVLAVEPDYEVHASDITQTPATWGLDRLDQDALPLNNKFTYGATGAGVTAFVIDTGIRATHAQFGGRVASGFTAIKDGRGTSDCAGHGTHVAGTIGGSTYGVAKAVTLVPVRVLDCNGSGSNSGVIAGVEWVTANHTGAAVANMSLGGSASTAVDTAVANSIASGVTYAVAGGNENDNACNYSPARLPAAITVGATTNTDARSSFSNYGTCLDVFAPGSGITSAINTSDTATAVYSGTSMASPHVAGVVAAYLETVPTALPADVRTALLDVAGSNLVSSIGTGSPNKLLSSLFAVTTPPPPPPVDPPPPPPVDPPPATNVAPVAVAPTAAIPVTGQLGSSAVAVKLSWSATDASGIKSYQLQQSTNGGGTWSNVGLPSPTTTSGTLNVNPSSTLRYRVRATDMLGLVGDYATSPTMALTLAQQNASSVSYLAGTWSTVSSSGASGGSLRQSKSTGAVARFTFTGTQVDWIGSLGSNRGIAEVFVDGTSYGTVDQYSSSSVSRRVLFSATLPSGSHYVEVKALGTKRSGSSNTYVDVDAFVSLR